MSNIIDGKKTAALIKGEIAAAVADRASKGLKIPHLAAILIGDNPSSETYVNNKVKDCAEVGFRSTLLRMKAEATEAELIDKINWLNGNSDIDGFIVQLPIPEQISETRVIEAIDPEKDADGFHPVNIGRMVTGIESYLPATPYGITELLKRYDITTAGRECVIIGRSNIVGRPLSIMLSLKGMDATVTVVHSRTVDIKSHLKRADIVVAAMGMPGFVTADMIREGAVVIDVGTTRVPSKESKSGWRLAGDVDYDSVAPKCSYITPVPGGVGPMTRVALLRNTLMAVRNK